MLHGNECKSYDNETVLIFLMGIFISHLYSIGRKRIRTISFQAGHLGTLTSSCLTLLFYFSNFKVRVSH